MATSGLHSYVLRSSLPPALMSTTSSIHLPLKCSFCNAPVSGMDMNNDSVQHRGKTEKSLGSCSSSDLWSSISAFLDDKQGGHRDSSESLLGLSTSLFNDVNAFSIDKEDPPEYIPAPTQNSADLELSKQLENVLYMLREILPGPIQKIGIETKLMEEASRLVHVGIKIQDPLVCFQGKDKLQAWLHVLAAEKVRIDLHDIYGERIIAPPGENSVYAIWTLLIPEEPQSTSQPCTFKGAENTTLELSLSGESKFTVDRSGQVVSVESNWHVPKAGEEILKTVKERLFSLLQEEMWNE